jgi:hypothetical protein
MGEVVNLRQARKRRDRAQRETEAEANRVKHGMSKAEKTLTCARREQDARKLDGHRLEPGDDRLERKDDRLEPDKD